MRYLLSLCITAQLFAAAAAGPLYDSRQDPLLEDPPFHFELHQPEEEEAPAPITKPEYELMNQPCLGWNFQAAGSVYNPDSEQELFLLTASAEVGGAVLLAIAAKGKAAAAVAIPGTAGAWAMAPMTNDRIAIGSYYDGAIHIFDLQQWEVTHSIDIPGEAYVWNLVEGADGRLYGGVFPGGKLIALDQDTLEIEDCGQVLAPNRFLHHVSPLPDGRLLCHVGDEEPATKIYDPQTGLFSDPPESLGSATRGVAWNGYFVTRNQLYDAQLRPTPPPFTAPDDDDGDDLLFETTASNADVLYARRGNRLYRCDAGETELVALFDIDLRGGRVLAPARNGGVYGVRGQQYFKISPGDTALERRSVGVPSPQRAPAMLRMDSRKQLWGAPASGHTLFFMDGDTGVFVSMGAVSPATGRVVDLAFKEHVAYGLSAPRGEIFTLDIDVAWEEWNGRNPRVVDALAERGYPRPTGGIHYSSADNALYSGWAAQSGVYGGAVAVTNLETERTRLLENPFGAQAVAGMALVDNYLFVGTSRKAENLPVQPDAAPQFGVLGLDTLQPYLNHPFDGATEVNRLTYNGQRNYVIMAVDDALQVFDVNAMRMRPPFDVPPVTSAAMAQRDDPYVYYGHETSLLRVHLDTGAWEQVVEMPADIGPMTSAPEGEIFLACGVHVFRVRFPEDYPDIAD